MSATLLELDYGVSLEELQRVLGAHGMTLMTNKRTQRPRVSRMPAFLTPGAVELATAQAEHGVEHLPRRDQRIVEPLHRRAYPRTGLSDFNLRRKS